MNTPITKFNIRVYAVVLNELNDCILLSDEYQLGMLMTKFPGGGMHLGEGTIDCLQREAMEEFGQSLLIIKHFYTTDFFQRAIHFEDNQLVSIYYLARFAEAPRFKISSKAFDFESNADGNQSFRWFALSDITPDIFTLPIDKKVAEMLQQSCF